MGDWRRSQPHNQAVFDFTTPPNRLLLQERSLARWGFRDRSRYTRAGRSRSEIGPLCRRGPPDPRSDSDPNYAGWLPFLGGRMAERCESTDDAKGSDSHRSRHLSSVARRRARLWREILEQAHHGEQPVEGLRHLIHLVVRAPRFLRLQPLIASESNSSSVSSKASVTAAGGDASITRLSSWCVFRWPSFSAAWRSWPRSSAASGSLGDSQGQ
jgi:hypothetical protein